MNFSVPKTYSYIRENLKMILICLLVDMNFVRYGFSENVEIGRFTLKTSFS